MERHVGGFEETIDRDAPPVLEVQEIASLSMLGKIAAMLDIEPTLFAQSEALPRGWHFALLPSSAQRSQLRADGFSGLGVPIPDLGLPRLMLIGRTVEYRNDLIIGDVVHRRSFIQSIEHKGEQDRPRALVKVCHELHGSAQTLSDVCETQIFMMMPEGKGYQAPQSPVHAVHGDNIRQITPDATLLFHFSALGFNAHKIHLDRDYARNVEGFPDLVVNGGLIALLVTEFVRIDLGRAILSLNIKYQSPLFCDRPATLVGTVEEGDAHPPIWQINVYDDRGTLAAQAKVDTI
jgi:3-methylfumaryl-CoA hydratase